MPRRILCFIFRNVLKQAQRESRVASTRMLFPFCQVSLLTIPNNHVESQLSRIISSPASIQDRLIERQACWRKTYLWLNLKGGAQKADASGRDFFVVLSARKRGLFAEQTSCASQKHRRTLQESTANVSKPISSSAYRDREIDAKIL